MANKGKDQGTYYYHGDHLASSNAITTRTGSVHEYIDYFPYGETWVHEKATTGESMPYKFTSKELDPETGLYYFGARYYDARLGVWKTVDPAFIEYLPTGNKDRDSNLPGIGGVFNTININVYHYADLNPLKFIDPDGREDIVFVKSKNPKIGRLESEALAFKNGTFSRIKFSAFKTWAAIKEFFGGTISKGDVELFLGKADKTFSDFSSLPDSTKDFGTVKSGEVYDYSRHDFNGMKAYLLTDPKLGHGKVPQDPKYGNPTGSNAGDKGTHPSYVEGSHLHKAFEMLSGWGGSKGCVIQKGFEDKEGMGTYLEKSKTGQSGHVIIFR